MFQLVDWYGHVGDATTGRAARGKDAHLTGRSIIYIIKQLTKRPACRTPAPPPPSARHTGAAATPNAGAAVRAGWARQAG
ncbi:hypothetical protein HS048_34545 [Planomonospora sp. ID91781]|uniref:hypothetical protein n=1 Tax=Planomonospora sp. ID91781 TaxID=2738135 RepID=UPI0018C3AF1E|nr:hypothetical protein [Planomonospora sp. ID91781]MBG0825805.1 hypothetical protein [Planomonospora sp. ID91781]